MISQTLRLMVEMYSAIGPGLILAAALPFFLAGFVLVLRAGLKRARQGGGRAA